MRRPTLQHLCETALLMLLAFVVLWKGGKTLESTWLLVGVAGLCALTQALERTKEDDADQPDPFPVIWVTALLFLFWTTLSYLASQTQNYGLDEVLRDSALLLILFWFLHESSTRDIPRECSFEERFLRLFARLTVISCAIGIVIYIAQPVNRFVGTFLDIRFHTDYWPNAYAEFLLLSWPIVLLRAEDFRPRESARRMIRFFAPAVPAITVGIVIGALFLTYSRGGIAAFLGQLGLLAIVLVLRRGIDERWMDHFRTIGIALFAGWLVFMGVNGLRAPLHPVESVQHKVTFTAAEGRSSIAERRSFWKQAVLLTLEKPLLGWGPYSFRFVQPRLQTSVLATSDHPHNVFLKLGMERGIFAVLLFVTLLTLALAQGSAYALTGKRLGMHSDHGRLGSGLLMVAVAGTLAHNLIDYNLQFAGIALPLMLFIAILLRSAEHRPFSMLLKERWLWLSTKTVILTNAFLAMLLLLVALREGFFLVTSSLGRHAEARGENITALQWYRRSENEWFSRDLLLSAANLSLHAGRSEDAEQALRTYLERHGEDARAWKLLGTALIAQGDFPGAIAAEEEAFRLGSWNDLGISRILLEALLAETYTQPTSAAAAASQDLPLHPSIATLGPMIEERVFAFADAIEKNLHFVALSPNAEEATNILITLSVLFPDRAERYHAAMQRIKENTAMEREKTRARAPGWLW